MRTIPIITAAVLLFLTGCDKEKPTPVPPPTGSAVGKTLTPGEMSAKNLTEIGEAIKRFDSDNGAFPAASTSDKAGKKYLSWRVLILPYLGDEASKNLYKQFKLDEPWDGPNNKELINKMPAVFSKPGDDPAKGMTHYKVFTGMNAVFSTTFGKEPTSTWGKWSIASLASSPRGTSNVLLCIEAADPVVWTKPEDIEYDQGKPLPRLKGVFGEGFLALKGDGSVVIVPPNYKESTLKAYIDPESRSTETLDQ